MSREHVKDLIEGIATGRSNTRDLLEQAVKDKAAAALDVKKVSVAKGFFGQKDE